MEIDHEGAEWLDSRKEAVSRIKSDALEQVRVRYSSKPYHNPTHTRSVIESALLLAKDLGLDPNEQDLVELVAAAHDLDQEKDSHTPDYQGENEANAAEWLVNELRRDPDVFLDDEIDRCRLAIPATRAGFRKPTPEELAAGTEAEGGRVRQSAPFTNDPQYLLAQILCDADLSNFGSTFEVYWQNFMNYYRERNPDGGTLDTWRGLLKIQVPILRNHRYYTEAARKRYNQLEANAARIEAFSTDEEQVRRTYEYFLATEFNNQKSPIWKLT